MSEPTFYPENGQPLSGDNEHRLLAKIAGNTYETAQNGGGGGGGSGGDASAANQVTGNASLSSIDTKTLAAGQALMAASSPVVIASNQSAIPVSGTFFQATQPVSAAALPLPAGASTEATLSSLNAKVTAVNTGAVVISSSALPSGAATSAAQTTAQTSLSSIDTKTLAAGQAVMASSSPVVIASNQTAVPISAASLPLPALAATSTKQSDGTQLTQLTNGTNAVAVTTVGADDESLTKNRLAVQCLNQGYDGTNVDMIRAGVTAATTTPTGFVNVIQASRYNATLAAVTEGQFTTGQCDAVGRLHTLPTTRSSGVSVAPTVSASPAYSVGDNMGGLITLANIADGVGTGVLHSLTVTCKSIQTNTFDAYFFTANPSATTFTDNAAVAINVADVDKVRGPFTLSVPKSGLGTHTVWTLDGIGKVFSLASGTTGYLCLIIPTGSATPTLGSTSDITVIANALKD